MCSFSFSGMRKMLRKLFVCKNQEKPNGWIFRQDKTRNEESEYEREQKYVIFLSSYEFTRFEWDMEEERQRSMFFLSSPSC